MLNIFTVTRRLFISAMSTVGVATTSAIAQTDDDSGYGAGQYGQVPYGGITDDNDGPDIGEPISGGGEDSDSDVDIGEPINYEPEPEPDLTIGEFTATEANPRNPHAEIEAEWSVEDTGGDLSDLMLRLEDARGGLITRYGEHLSGDSSTGSWEHRIRHGGSETYVLSILVETADGRSSTDSVTI